MADAVKYYPLTHPQKGIWYTEKMYPNTSIGNIAATLRLKGDIDYSILEKAINIFIQKNDGMRLKVVEIDGEPQQYVADYEPKQFDFYDFSNSTIEELYKWDGEQSQIPFDIIDKDLYYYALVKINENDGGFFVKTHHLISDAWTMSLMGNQIVEFYTTLKNGEAILADKKNSYIEHIQSEKEYEDSDRFIKDKEYWHNIFEMVSEPTILKLHSSNYSDIKAKRKTFIVPTKLTELIHKYCSLNKATVASLFLAGLALYINRVTTKEDLVIGTMVLNRTNRKEKDTVGMFISTAPIRVNVSEGIKFNSFVEQLSSEWMKLLKHQKYPYDLLQKEIRTKHNIINNLNDILISYQNAKFNKEEHNEKYDTRWHFNGYQTDSLGIHINDREDQGDLIIDYDYQIELFSTKEIEFINDHIIRILWHALDDPTKEISKLHMLSEKEYKKILFDFNDTQVEYSRDRTINEIFEEQVKKTPNDVAIVFENTRFTYRELNEKANQVANVLRKNNIKPNNAIGLIVERSLEMVIGIMAILKAGGAYLPIDPNYPKDRIKYVIKDSGVKVVLTQEHLKDLIEFKGQVIILDDNKNYEGDKSNLLKINNPNDLAYIIYTSGSTGKPKGVMVEHSSVINLWNWFGKKYSLNKNKNVINLTTFTFDVSIEEIIVSLLCSATVFIPKKETILNKSAIIKYMKDNKINIAQFVPSLLREILLDYPKLADLNVVICGGEALDQQLNEEIVTLGYNLYNHYGPTEITVDALSTKCCKDKVTLGKPINNCKCYILDKNFNPLPIGIAGELFISGEGVTRGYLNEPGLTKKVFVSNPYEPGKKMYKTGDIARWYPQGDIQYLGRADEQVKIRGYRVELGEIKKKLLECKGVKDAVVTTKLDKRGNNQLVAYVVTEQNEFNINNGEDIYKIRTCKQKPYMQKNMEILHSETWPRFFMGDKIHVEYWSKLYNEFSEFQIALFDEDQNMLAIGNAVPICWNRKKEDLPIGWDDALLRGFNNKRNNEKTNTLCVLAGVVNGVYKGKGLSYKIIEAMKLIASFNKLSNIIIPVRPTLKENYPYMKLKDYTYMRQKDNYLYDNWLRVHENLGGKVIGLSEQSQKIVGGVKEWEMWTGQKFKESGKYLVKGGMQPININVETNEGYYYDQAVWIKHSVKKIRKEFIDIGKIKEHLANKLPDYMIPTNFIIIDKIPLKSNGKVDVKLLERINLPISNKGEYISPRDKFEEQISKIWSDILGIEKVGINEDFFDLGGDSLSVIGMVSKIEKLVNKQIQVSTIYKNRTIDKLSKIIKDERNNIIENITLLRRGTTDKNIFFIHGGSGSIGGYSNLFRENNLPLNEEYNCYAIKFDKLDGYNPTKVSIEELAQEYVKRILSVQPSGKYNLAAWCIGGQIIHQMATILENEFKHKVESVIMINSFAPKKCDIYYNFKLEEEIKFIKEILTDKINISEIAKFKNIKDLWQYITDFVKGKDEEIKGVIPIDILESIPNYKSLDILDIIYYINVMRSLHNARAEYFPKGKLKAQSYYFQPLKDTTISNHKENIALWQKYCSKKIQKIEVDADEHTVFDEDINKTIKLLNGIL